MGRRTLTASELTFHEKYARNAATFAPCDLEGDDLADLFEAWAIGLSIDDTKDDERQNWVEILDVSRYASRVIVVTLGVGAYGESGPVIDSTSGDKVFYLTETQAPTGENRAVLMVPAKGESAFYLTEESTRGAAGGRLLRLFKKYFSDYSAGITMDTLTVTESEAWSAGANLTEVEVRVKGTGADVADGLHVEVGSLSHIARPQRRSIFPKNLLRELQKDRLVARQLVGVDVLEEAAEVYVTLERDHRTKKFIVGRDAAPAIREVLNDAGSPALSVDDLVNLCADKVSDLAGRTGGSWDHRWSTPTGG